jgi:enoyl-CoA hydratase/carnithine racemase
MTEAVNLRIAEGIAEVCLNRPDAYNAINNEVIDGLLAAGETIRNSPEVRAVVLYGYGKGFCAGLDMANFGDMASGDLTAESADHGYQQYSESGANMVQHMAWQWRELDVPVIAALHGAAMGGGLNLALGADIRIAAPDAKFGFVEISFGLLPDMSATRSLQRLLPLDRIMELVLSGRKLKAEEALAYGLVTRIEADPLQAARDLAMSIARYNPDAVKRGKRLLVDAASLNDKDGLVAESDASRELLGTPNQLEAVLASLEGRAPNYL